MRTVPHFQPGRAGPHQKIWYYGGEQSKTNSEYVMITITATAKSKVAAPMIIVMKLRKNNLTEVNVLSYLL